MKIKFLIASLCFIFLASCDSNNSSSSSNGGSNYTPSYEPEYFTEDAPEQSICGNCNGNGGWYDAYGRILYCPICHGAGTTIIFKSRQGYFAECSHHSYCKLYHRTSAGDSYCSVCKCLRSSHVRRYR